MCSMGNLLSSGMNPDRVYIWRIGISLYNPLRNVACGELPHFCPLFSKSPDASFLLNYVRVKLYIALLLHFILRYVH